MRVEVRIDTERQYYLENDHFRTEHFHEMSSHISVKYLNTLVEGTDIDMVIVRQGYPDIAHRIYHDPFTKSIKLDMNARRLN